MKKIFFIILILVLIPKFSWAEDSKKRAVYFYSESSPLCQEVNDYFLKEKIWESFEIKKIDVSSSYNMDYLNEFFDVFRVAPDKRGWPAIFFDQEIIVGSNPIIENFLAKMGVSSADNFPTPQAIKKGLQDKKEKQAENLMANYNKNFSFFVLIGAALIDGINPCMFGIAIIFLTILFLIRKKARVYILSLSFLTGLLVFYFLLGFVFVILSWNVIKFSQFFSLSASAILILMSIMKIRVALGLKEKKIKILFIEKIQDYTKKSLGKSWFLFFLGFISGYILIPCSHKPYLTSMQSVFLKGGWQSFGLVILYNLIFILPILLLMVVFFVSAKNKKLDNWEEKNFNLINFIMGLILIFVGIYLVQNWINF